MFSLWIIIRLIQFISITTIDITLLILAPQLLTYLLLLTTFVYISIFNICNVYLRNSILLLIYLVKIVFSIVICVYIDNRIIRIISYILSCVILINACVDYLIYNYANTEEHKIYFRYRYYTFKNKPTRDENENCPICLGPLSQEQYLTKCEHTFCKQCLDDWIKQNKNSCPNCRQDLYLQC